MVTFTKAQLQWIRLELARAVRNYEEAGDALSMHYAEAYKGIIDQIDAAISGGSKRIQIV